MAAMAARTVAGRWCQASMTACNCGSLLQVSVGKWWATGGCETCKFVFGLKLRDPPV